MYMCIYVTLPNNDLNLLYLMGEFCVGVYSYILKKLLQKNLKILFLFSP